MTVVATALSVFGIARFLNPQDPRGVMTVLLLSFLPFAWITGFLNFVEERIIETEETGVTKDYDGSTPLNLPLRDK